MEFDFNVNQVLSAKVTVVRCDLTPVPTAGHWTPSHASNLENIIDKMGVASAKAQGLQFPITTSAKLRLSNHTLYIMKDAEANKGLGSVIGILKVGKKQLFLSDSSGEQYNTAPLCLLDIYIHESRQRTGCGLQLLQHVILEERYEPRMLAIDRPSQKLLSFLQKHYNLVNPLQQGNNFTVFPDIFQTLSSGSCRSAQDTTTKVTLRSNRSSFPPYSARTSLPAFCSVASQRDSSVGAVVFGTASQTNLQSETQMPPASSRRQPIYKGSEDLNKTWAFAQIPTAARFSTCRDSSFNIFGVPSPSNRMSTAAEDLNSMATRHY